MCGLYVTHCQRNIFVVVDVLFTNIRQGKCKMPGKNTGLGHTGALQPPAPHQKLILMFFTSFMTLLMLHQTMYSHRYAMKWRSPKYKRECIQRVCRVHKKHKNRSHKYITNNKSRVKPYFLIYSKGFNSSSDSS